MILFIFLLVAVAIACSIFGGKCIRDAILPEYPPEPQFDIDQALGSDGRGHGMQNIWMCEFNAGWRDCLFESRLKPTNIVILIANADDGTRTITMHDHVGRRIGEYPRGEPHFDELFSRLTSGETVRAWIYGKEKHRDCLKIEIKIVVYRSDIVVSQ